MLYGDKCRAGLVYDRAEVTLLDRNTKKVTVAITARRASNPSYVGGIFTTDTSIGSLHWIVKDVQTTIRRAGFTFYRHELTLKSSLPSELVLGGTVFMAPGCNRTITDCSEIHKNIDNFGGFWAMGQSPFEGGLRG